MAWENKVTPGYIHYSRYIASWTKVCTNMGKPVRFYDDFENWLRSFNLPDEDVYNILEMARCGKLELETSARTFLEQKRRKAG